MFGILGSSDKNVVPDTVLTNGDIELIIDEAVSVDQENKTCALTDGSKISFSKLIFATGSSPIRLQWLAGIDLKNVFFIPKEKEYLDKEAIIFGDYKKVVVIGGGFIGVEMADELVKAGKDVTIIELLPHVLSLAFDAELASRAEDALIARGVKICSGKMVNKILVKERGFDVITGMFEGIDRHPGSLPDTHKQIVKLIASKDSGIILGGEVFGGTSVGELTNLIGFIIQNRMTVEGVLTSQIGTHPLLTGPPTAYALIKAAEMIAIKRNKYLC